MTTQPTPRPWQQHSGAVYDSSGTVLLASMNRSDRASPYEGGDKRPNPIYPVERDANAALICRAVNSHDVLVEALKSAIWDIEKELCAASDSLDHPTFKAKAKNVKRYKAILKLAEVQP